MRFRYDPSRPRFEVVTAIELGDFDRGYSAIDITGKDPRPASRAPSTSARYSSQFRIS